VPIDDEYDLRRFVDAQRECYARVQAELSSGRKTSHWMWFVFPQLSGLGRSPIAERYAISSLDEAKAYLAHAVLGPRLEECTALVNAVEGKSLREIFGSPDDLKFRSSMTLFAHAAPRASVFREALEKYCGGEEDPLTLALLNPSARGA
jgi:uncharacterized protein (DUF1810 family)